jgi:drug/metabolite transporter (DMT)-like permease
VVFGMLLFGERHPPWIMLSMLGLIIAIALTSWSGKTSAKER